MPRHDLIPGNDHHKRTDKTTNRRTAQAAAAAIHGFQLPILVAIKTPRTIAAPNTVMILAATPKLARISHSQICAVGGVVFPKAFGIGWTSFQCPPDP